MQSIQSMPSPNHFTGRAGYAVRWLILHGTAGFETAQECADYFATIASQVSSHYIVGRDGTIIQCVSESDAAWANGALGAGHDPWWSDAVNPNYLTIAIEHVKPSTDNSDILTAAQQTAAFALIADICARNAIPMRAADSAGGITGHYSIDPVNRARCPGFYPWAALWSYVQQGGTMIPQGWSDNGSVLTAPNKIIVVRGFRDYIVAPGSHWESGNWPLEAEHAANPIELSNPTLGTGTIQTFRWSRLEWTPSRGVFAGWLGQELLAVETRLAAKVSEAPEVVEVIVPAETQRTHLV